MSTQHPAGKIVLRGSDVRTAAIIVCLCLQGSSLVVVKGKGGKVFIRTRHLGGGPGDQPLRAPGSYQGFSVPGRSGGGLQVRGVTPGQCRGQPGRKIAVIVIMGFGEQLPARGGELRVVRAIIGLQGMIGGAFPHAQHGPALFL